MSYQGGQNGFLNFYFGHYLAIYLVTFKRLNLFVKIDLQLWLDKPFQQHIEPPPKTIQGVLFLKNRIV